MLARKALYLGEKRASSTTTGATDAPMQDLSSGPPPLHNVGPATPNGRVDTDVATSRRSQRSFNNQRKFWLKVE